MELRERRLPVPWQAQVGAPDFLHFYPIFLGWWLCRSLSLPHKHVCLGEAENEGDKYFSLAFKERREILFA